MFANDFILGMQTIDYIINCDGGYYRIRRLHREFETEEFFDWKTSTQKTYFLRYQNNIHNAFKQSKRHPNEGYVLICFPDGAIMDSRL